MNWDTILWSFDFLSWYLVMRNLILQFVYLKKLKARIDEKYPPISTMDPTRNITQQELDSFSNNLELKLKIGEIKYWRVYLQFWHSFSYFYNDPEFPTKEEIMLLRLQK